MNEMRDILCGTLDKITAGKITAAQANAVANVTGKVFTSIKLEMEYSKMSGRQPDVKCMGMISGHSPKVPKKHLNKSKSQKPSALQTNDQEATNDVMGAAFVKSKKKK